MRADQLLVERGLAPSRSAAQRLIGQGAVRYRLGAGPWMQPTKTGQDLPLSCELELTDDSELRWASRGGLKLAGALQRTGLNPSGWRCLDAGQSTGGFTDVLLHHGARQVLGADVGHGQLHPRLRTDPRVTPFERVNLREPEASTPGRALLAAVGQAGVDGVVADLSFISITHVLPTLARLARPGAELLLLVKPQFELQPADIDHRGLVQGGPVAHTKALTRVVEAAQALQLRVRDTFESPVQGGDGNHEFFVWARKEEHAAAPTATQKAAPMATEPGLSASHPSNPVLSGQEARP